MPSLIDLPNTFAADIIAFAAINGLPQEHVKTGLFVDSGRFGTCIEASNGYEEYAYVYPVNKPSLTNLQQLFGGSCPAEDHGVAAIVTIERFGAGRDCYQRTTSFVEGNRAALLWAMRAPYRLPHSIARHLNADPEGTVTLLKDSQQSAQMLGIKVAARSVREQRAAELVPVLARSIMDAYLGFVSPWPDVIDRGNTICVPVWLQELIASTPIQRLGRAAAMLTCIRLSNPEDTRQSSVQAVEGPLSFAEGYKRSSFSYKLSNGAVHVHDDTDEHGGMTVTNNAEAVVTFLLHMFGGSYPLYYRDTLGNWAELKHDGNRFRAFAPAQPPAQD